MNFRERMLSKPVVYRTLKRIVMPDGLLDRLVGEHFVADDGSKVLDLGCGYGDYAPFYADRCDYLGIDHNASYIQTARRLNAGSAAQFIVADVADPVVREHGPFDLVIMSGVLHHLASPAVRDLAALVRPLMSPTGRFVALEPVFHPEQGLTARLTIAADRGRFARDEDGYRALFEAEFPKVDTTVVSGLLRIPYTHVVLTAST
jgi:SAM-dependent methyltransferase